MKEKRKVESSFLKHFSGTSLLEFPLKSASINSSERAMEKQQPAGKTQERAKESLVLNLPVLGKKVVLDDITPVGGGRSSCLKCGQMLSGLCV